MDWPEVLAGRRLVVEVPATTANLGAGYDCLGLALDLVNRIEVEPRLDSAGRIELTVETDAATDLPTDLPADRSNRFVQSLELGLRQGAGELPADLGWCVQMRLAVPVARGLGSSATASIGGLAAANALLHGAIDPILLPLATAVEGHPDNAAAALLGGFVVVDVHEPVPLAIRFDVPPSLLCVLFVPDRQLSTDSMRACLPASVPRADAVANLGRVALGVAGIARGRLDVLDGLTRDLLHEQYREPLYPELPKLVAAARGAGAIGACLSGAGSTVVAFTDSAAAASGIGAALAGVASACGLTGAVRTVAPRNEGVRVVEL